MIKMSPKFWNILGVLCILGGIALGLYVGIYLCLYGGIVQIVNAVQLPVIPAGKVAWGVVRVLCTGLAGWVTLAFCWGVGSFFFLVGEETSRSTWLHKRR